MTSEDVTIDSSRARQATTATPARRVVEASVRTATAARVVIWGLAAGLAWVPLWYGSNDLFAWGVNAILFPGLALAYEISILVRGERHPIGIRNVALPAGLFAAVLFWVWLQTVAGVPSTLSHPIWSMTAATLGKPITGSISVNRDFTAQALIELITVASVFWLALQLCRDAARAMFLLRAIAVIVAAYAAWGLAAFALHAGRLPWLESSAGVGYVSSTFINRNSFATYAGMGLVVASAFILQLYRHGGASGYGPWRLRLADFIETTGERGPVLLGCAFLILVALLLSVSRGGIIATGLGLFVLAASTFKRRRRRAAELLETIGFGTVLVAAVFLVFGDAFVGKLGERGLADTNRMAVNALSLRSIRDAPLTGYGLGTFTDIFPLYRDRSISVFGVWEQAHDSYAEIFQGLGLVFGSMLLASVLILVIRCARGMIIRQEHVIFPRVAAACACLVGVHAFVDFSLQIEAIAITFAALLGAGVAQSESSRVLVHD
jgi:O-antigen ligase